MRKGFTLVEVLAALTIFLVIVSASYALFEGGRGMAAHGELESRRHQQARAALRAIEADIKGLFATETAFKVPLVGKNGGTPEKPSDTLEFAAVNHAPPLATPVTSAINTTPRESDISRVSFAIDEEASTIEAGLVRRRTKLMTDLSTVKDPNAGLEEIATDVAGLDFRFWDGSAWAETWDSTTTGDLPKIVEATVHVRATLRGVEDTQKFMTRIFLPVAAATPKKQ